jgi:hypothetical protein
MTGSEGYFLAKREAAQAIHNRVMILEEKRASGLKNMTDEAAEKVDKQLKELGIE